jgi:hypothetical protein
VQAVFRKSGGRAADRMDQGEKKMKTKDWNKRKHIGKMLVFLAVLLAVVLPKGITARVYGAENISNLKQTGATTKSVDVQFSAFLGLDVQYEIRVGTGGNSVSAYMTLTSQERTATITGLASGSTYYVQVVPFQEVTEVIAGDDDEDAKEVVKKQYWAASAKISVVTAPEKAPSSVAQTDSGTDNVTIAWGAVSGASGYIVEYFLSGSALTDNSGSTVTDNSGSTVTDNSGSAMTEKASSATSDDDDSYMGVSASSETATLTTTSTSIVLTGLSATKSYTARVTPYRISVEGYMAYDSSICTSKSNLAIGAVVAGTPEGTVSGFAQKSAAADSVTLSFKVPDEKAQYSVQLGQSKDGQFTEYAVVKEGSVSLTELKAASSYYVRVVPFYPRWNSFNQEYDRTYGTASGVFEVVTAPNAKPKKITQTAATVTGFTVSWDVVDGASGYYVDYYCAGSTKKTTEQVTNNQIRLTGLTKNSEYNIYVTPYKKSASGFVAMDEANYASSYNIPVRPSKAGNATVTKFWKSIGKVILKTKKIACADGYQYVLYTAYSDTDKKIASTSSAAYSSADIKSMKLKKSAVFKVRVRAYITVEDKKVYGAWSDWTYISSPVQVKLTRSEDGIHAGWSRVKGADRYVVYISTDKDIDYKKCFVTKKNSCDISSYGKKSIKTGKKYYVYVIPQMKVSGKYVSVTKKDAVATIK